MIPIACGSTNVHKVSAVRFGSQIAGIEALVTGVETKSVVNAQPVGLDETFLGAQARAQLAIREHPDMVCVGIESGILRSAGVTLDLAVVVVLMPNGDRFVSTSQGIRFPETYVLEAEERGFATTTVGMVIAEHLFCDPRDPHAALTRGRVRRVESLAIGVSAAFAQVRDWG